MISQGDSGAGDRAPLFLRATSFVVRIFGAVSAALLLVVFAVVIYAVAQRYFFGRPLLWGDETTGWLLIAMILFGAAEAYRQNDHIAMDIVSSRVKGRGAILLRALFDLAVFAVAVVIAVSAWEAIAFARSFGSYTTGNFPIPSWIPQTPLLIGSVLLALMALARLGALALRRTAP